jgi:hypothetical protein
MSRSLLPILSVSSVNDRLQGFLSVLLLCKCRVSLPFVMNHDYICTCRVLVFVAVSLASIMVSWSSCFVSKQKAVLSSCRCHCRLSSDKNGNTSQDYQAGRGQENQVSMCPRERGRVPLSGRGGRFSRYCYRCCCSRGRLNSR